MTANAPARPRGRELPTDKAYRLLESGPIVLVTTAGKDGVANVMTMGFHMVIQHAPPLIGCVIGPWDHSHAALKQTGECVIAIPPVGLAKTMVDIGNCSGTDTDKFAQFGLTPRKAKHVGAPLIAECMANIECRVADTAMVSRYNLWILDVLRIRADADWRDQRMMHHRGDGTFAVDGRVIDLRKRMVKWQMFQD